MNTNETIIGVLAFQGAFAKHKEVLLRLGVKVVEVKKPADLLACDALIIPGGESTTMMKQMKFINFNAPFSDFAKEKPVFGTCAGLILMSEHILGDQMIPFCLIDIDVERNAFGRQSESFQTEIELNLKRNSSKLIPACFIRAPRIRRVGKDVKILAVFDEEPVLVEQGMHLAASFHPELTFDSSIHAYFLDIVSTSKKNR